MSIFNSNEHYENNKLPALLLFFEGKSMQAHKIPKTENWVTKLIISNITVEFLISRRTKELKDLIARNPSKSTNHSHDVEGEIGKQVISTYP